MFFYLVPLVVIIHIRALVLVVNYFATLFGRVRSYFIADPVAAVIVVFIFPLVVIGYLSIIGIV